MRNWYIILGLPIFIQSFMLWNAPITVFDFTPSSNIKKWRIINDDVMGGRSTASIAIDADGNGIFKGHVSLDNNGGFASTRYLFSPLFIPEKAQLVLRVKGDGKRYQLRVKPNASDYYSYITYFQTSGDWEEITIAMSDLYPSFRGQKLRMPNFDAPAIEEIAILIANKKAESFQIAIDYVQFVTP